MSTRDIPVVVVARGPRILELGGRIADGVMVASMASPAAVTWGIEHVRAGMRQAARPAEAVELSSMLYTSISEDGPAARWIVRRGIAAALLGSFPSYDFLAASALAVPPELWTLLQTGECAAQIERIVASGIRHVVLAPLPVDELHVESVIEPFAREVVPRVRAAGIVV